MSIDDLEHRLSHHHDILGAELGDETSASHLLMEAVYCLRSGKPLPVLLSTYLADAMEAIIDGRDANDALHINQSRCRGRNSSDNARRDRKITRQVVELNFAGKPLKSNSREEGALATVAQQLHMSEDNVWRIYKATNKEVKHGIGREWLYREILDQEGGEEVMSFLPLLFRWADLLRKSGVIKSAN